MRELEAKLGALEHLLKQSIAPTQEEVSGVHSQDPIILVTAPSLDSQDEPMDKVLTGPSDTSKMAFPGSGGKLFQVTHFAVFAVFATLPGDTR